MFKERFRLISAVHLLLIEDEQILLLRRFNTGYEDGNYSVIAGHLDGNETARRAMIREAREETGIEITSDNLELVHVMHRNADDHERIDFFFTTKLWHGVLQNLEPDKCDNLSWFPVSKLPDNIVPYVRVGIRNFFKKKIFSEFGWSE